MAYSLTQNHSLLVQKSTTAFFRGSSSKTLRPRPLSRGQPGLLRFRRGALAFKQDLKNNLGGSCHVASRSSSLKQSRPLRTATCRAVPESSEDMVEDASESPWLMTQAQKAAGLATFLAADMFLKKVFVAANIAFPSALGGMFVILGTLLALEVVSNSTVEFLFRMFNPALDWIARWLPLFYMPSLIVLPVAIQVPPVHVLVVLSVVTSLSAEASQATAKSLTKFTPFADMTDLTSDGQS
ncbi:hypothetical protein CYMTET_23547 [Cymbomonas tetramitiformis]|uniref:Uncharacterized protein n=1 Tax=Cymbomonas tetramitiformis TaxID=36881 RepID=A0AAE0FXY6_9CHLO|nr:hypothetical protein CYMTET_23547 [Cymbomonas tetramitiformis]